MKTYTTITLLMMLVTQLSFGKDFTLQNTNLNGYVHISERFGDDGHNDIYISRAQIHKVAVMKIFKKESDYKAMVSIIYGYKQITKYYFKSYAEAQTFVQRIVTDSKKKAEQVEASDS